MKAYWTLVDGETARSESERIIGTAGALAIDTEYDSFRYFHDKLCLIQVQTDSRTWLIDPLAGLDLAFLGRSFADPAVLKIFHAGDNDIRILKRDYGFGFVNIFDTHRAASLLGYRLLSLSTLLETLLGVTLEKKMQRSRWDLRPLSAEQLDYAALDTAHLTDLYRRLDAELQEKELKSEAKRLFAEITTVVWRPRVLDRSAYRRITGYAELTAGQKERLHLLYRWRFEKAEEINRACFMLLSDPQLLGLARLENPSLQRMTGPGLLSAEGASRFGSEILHLLTESIAS